MNIARIIEVLTNATKSFPQPLINQIIVEFGHSPYLILIACLLSLRAQDKVTIHVCRVLFNRVRTPEQLLALPLHELEEIIYRSGYYKTKATVLRGVSETLLKKYGGEVPESREALLSMKGVGLKTAHLVLGMAFNQAAICVDTHVHRISNRLGLIATKTPEETETALQKVLEKRYWTVWNYLLVMWGQQVCGPISPRCSECPLRLLGCKRVGVTKSR